MPSAGIDEPIAYGFQSSTAVPGQPGVFEYFVSLGSATTWAALNILSWRIVDAQGVAHGSGLSQFAGSSGTVAVTVPRAIGLYSLEVTVSNGALSTTHAHTLYVLIDAPLMPGQMDSSSVISYPTTPGWIPATAWLNFATVWASGATTGDQAMTQLTKSFYSNPMHWIYASGGYTLGDGARLLEQGGSGICWTFQAALAVLGGSLGTPVFTYPLGMGAFIMPPGPGHSTAPCRSSPTCCAAARWHLEYLGSSWDTGPHGIVEANNTFYDPTFGLITHGAVNLPRSYVWCQETAWVDGSATCAGAASGLFRVTLAPGGTQPNGGFRLEQAISNVQ